MLRKKLRALVLLDRVVADEHQHNTSGCWMRYRHKAGTSQNIVDVLNSVSNKAMDSVPVEHGQYCVSRPSQSTTGLHTLYCEQTRYNSWSAKMDIMKFSKTRSNYCDIVTPPTRKIAQCEGRSVTNE